MSSWLAGLLWLALPLQAQPTAPMTLTVGADSSLREVLRELVTNWAEENSQVELSIANTQRLRLQMEKGANWDLLITSDPESLVLLTAAKKIALKGQVKLARNRLVIYAHKPLTPDEDPEWFQLIGEEWGTIAMVDPAESMSGRAAQAALEKRKLWSEVKGKIKLTSNENSALDLAKRNQVDAVILCYSDVANVKIPGYQVYDIDQGDYPALGYVAALSADSSRSAVAQTFLQYMASAEARPVWAKWGFWAPQ